MSCHFVVANMAQSDDEIVNNKHKHYDCHENTNAIYESNKRNACNTSLNVSTIERIQI